MEKVFVFCVGNIIMFPAALMIMSNNAFILLLSVFYVLLLIVTGKRYFKRFWAKYFEICKSFDEYLYSGKLK